MQLRLLTLLLLLNLQHLIPTLSEPLLSNKCENTMCNGDKVDKLIDIIKQQFDAQMGLLKDLLSCQCPNCDDKGIDEKSNEETEHSRYSPSTPPVKREEKSLHHSTTEPIIVVEEKNLLLDQNSLKNHVEYLMRYGHLRVHTSSSTPIQEEMLEEFTVTKMLDFDDMHEISDDIDPEDFEYVELLHEPFLSGTSDPDVPRSFLGSSSSSKSPLQVTPSRIGRIDKPSSLDMGGAFSIFPDCDGDCPMFPKAQRKHSSTSSSTISLHMSTPTPALVESRSRRMQSTVSSTSSAPSTRRSTTRKSRTIFEIPSAEKNPRGQSSGFWIFPDCDGDCPSFPKAHQKLNPIRLAPFHYTTLSTDRIPDQDIITNIPASVTFKQEITTTRAPDSRQGKVEQDYNDDVFSIFPDCDGDCPGIPRAVKKN